MITKTHWVNPDLPIENDTLIPILQAVEMIGYSYCYVYQLMRDGVVDKIKKDKHTYLTKSDIDKLVQLRQTQHPVGEAKIAQTKKRRRDSVCKSRRQWKGVPNDQCPNYIVNRRKMSNERYKRKKAEISIKRKKRYQEQKRRQE